LTGRKDEAIYNPAAGKLVPNEDFGIAFNGNVSLAVLTGQFGTSCSVVHLD